MALVLTAVTRDFLLEISGKKMSKYITICTMACANLVFFFYMGEFTIKLQSNGSHRENKGNICECVCTQEIQSRHNPATVLDVIRAVSEHTRTAKWDLHVK